MIRPPVPRRRLSRRPVVATLGLVAAVAVAAVSLPATARADAWSAEVAVADRSIAEQREAYALAMRAVLLANAGDKTLLNRDDVRAALGEAERYVARFGYRRPEPGTLIAPGTPLTAAVRESGEATQLMQVRFDRGRLEALIRRESDDGTPGEDGTPEDPLADFDRALLWLLVEDGRREVMIAEPAAANLRARAREIAGAGGVALVYPSGDEEDRAALDAAALREGRIESIREASLRYAPEVVIVGHLERDGLDRWQGSWTRLGGERVERERFVDESLEQALEAGIGWSLPPGRSGEARYRYGGDALSDSEGLVWVGALDAIEDYARVMDFLAGVGGVATVYPKEADTRGMTFAVVPRGALPAIASAASGTPWLRRSAPPLAAPEPSPAPFGGVDDAFGVADEGDDPRFDSASSSPRRRGPAVSLAGDAELAFDYLR